MPPYTMLFLHDIDTKDEHLRVGDAFGYQGVIWLVEEIDATGRLILNGWPSERPYPPEVKGVDPR